MGGVGWRADASTHGCTLAKTRSVAQAEVARTCVYAAFKARATATGHWRVAVAADACTYAGDDRARCAYRIYMTGATCTGEVALSHLSKDPARIRARGVDLACVS
jgi:hypothetical protein